MTLAVLLPGAAFAQSCAGVEERVNDRTSEVREALLERVDERRAALVAQELAERQELLAAMKVFVRQLSTANSQEVNAAQEAAIAGAQVVVEQSARDQLLEAVREYGDAGHDPCGLVEQGYEVEDARRAAAGLRGDLADAIMARHAAATPEEHVALAADWAQLAQGSDAVTAEALFAGDADEAAAFISLALGPPRAPVGSGSGRAAARADRVAALRHLARQSIAATVLADIAAADRVDEALQGMAERWTGEGAAEQWAARQAATSTRGALLDTARVEAANLAIAANALQRDIMEEFALAGFALTYVDRSYARRAAP